MAALPGDAAADPLFWPLLAPEGGGVELQHMDDLEARALARLRLPQRLLTTRLRRSRQGWLSMALGSEGELGPHGLSPLKARRAVRPPRT